VPDLYSRSNHVRSMPRSGNESRSNLRQDGGASNSTRPVQRGVSADEQARTPRLGRPPTRNADLRKPNDMSQETWDVLDYQVQRLKTHIGRIQETSAAHVAPDACSLCKQNKEICLVYTETSRKQYVGRENGYGCARCRIRAKRCSIQVNF
jgi:hypothetical protein